MGLLTVGTALTGHALLNAHDHFYRYLYLQVAVRGCEHSLRDLDAFAEGEAVWRIHQTLVLCQFSPLTSRASIAESIMPTHREPICSAGVIPRNGSHRRKDVTE